MRPILAALLIAALPAAAPAESPAYKGYAAVPYAVDRAEGGIELRRYPPRTVAEVTVRGTRGPAVNRGFRELFGYITGDNAAGGKIAMTVPVDQTETERGWTTRFTMPEGATLDSLPAPDEAHVRLRRLPAERMLVARFTGRATDARLAEAEAALRAHAARAGLRVTGAPVIMFYDDPFTLPWNRRNELGLALAR